MNNSSQSHAPAPAASGAAGAAGKGVVQLAIALLGALMFWAGSLRADYLLLPDSRTVPAGGVLEVTLFIPNDSTAELAVDLPERLTLRTRGVSAAPDIVLTPAQTGELRQIIKAGGFLRARYAGRLPEGLVGNLVLEPVDFTGPALGISAAQAKATRPAAKVPAADAGDDAPTMGPSDRDTARFVSAFSPYEPNYFSIGSDGPTNAKFQVSLKFRLFNPNTQTPFLEKLYLAYSQTSIWAIGSSSKPFYDSSYRPSVFFLDEDVAQWPLRKWARLGFQTGVEHESNGKDGIASRSINIGFIRPSFTLPLGDHYFVSASPRIYSYFEKEDNPDLPRYRGYSDLLVKVGQNDGIQLATTLRKGTGKDPYSVQFDLSYPLKPATLGNLGGYFHLQYFDGYGESLVDYNRRVRSQFRIGLMITR